MAEQANESDTPPRRTPWVKILAGTAIALVIIAGAMVFQSMRICDQHVTSGGQVVEACRHLQMTDPPVVAGALIIAVSLTAFFSEIGAFGFLFKKDIAAAQAAAESARESAAQAKGAENSVNISEQVASKLVFPNLENPRIEGRSIGQLQELADEYNKIRRTMPSGAARTNNMTEVVASMISASSVASDEEIAQILKWLDSADRGLRLASYAALYSRPNSSYALRLAQLAAEEDKPFNQYWALRALRNIIRLDPPSLDSRIRLIMENLLPRVDHDGSRAYQIRDILRTKVNKNFDI